MGKKRKKKVEREAPQETAAPDNSGNAGRWVAIMLLVLGSGVFLYALTTDGPPAPANDHAGHTASAAIAQRDPGQTGQYRYFENPDAAHPLPVTLPPSQFQNAGIANTYAVAKEIPEVLAQQPCLCGCDNTSDDHRSLLDCYIDDHASTCMVCMKEAVYASEMTEAGESAEWIRDAILRNEFADMNIGN